MMNLRAKIRRDIRLKVSPRHVPDDILQAPGIPHTHTRKSLKSRSPEFSPGGHSHRQTRNPSTTPNFIAGTATSDSSINGEIAVSLR